MKTQFAALFFALSVSAAPADKPNIVFFLADHMAYRDISHFGQKTFSTPNIDRLANEGRVFLKAYAGGWSKADVNDKQIVKAAQFAVKAQQEVMKKAGNADILALVKITAAEKQVVAGMNYSITMRVKVGGNVKAAKAKVWEKAWQNLIELTSWEFVEPAKAKTPEEAK